MVRKKFPRLEPTWVRRSKQLLQNTHKRSNVTGRWQPYSHRHGHLGERRHDPNPSRLSTNNIFMSLVMFLSFVLRGGAPALQAVFSLEFHKLRRCQKKIAILFALSWKPVLWPNYTSSSPLTTQKRHPLPRKGYTSKEDSNNDRYELETCTCW